MIDVVDATYIIMQRVDGPELTEYLCRHPHRRLTAEIAGGSLVVNKAVVVRKVAGESRLVVEGAYGDDYLRVRDLLYAQYTVV